MIESGRIGYQNYGTLHEAAGGAELKRDLAFYIIVYTLSIASFLSHFYSCKNPCQLFRLNLKG